MRDRADVVALCFIGTCLAVVVALILFLAYLLGYAVGLYSVPCQLDSTQPHCVQAGWGHAVRIEKP